MKRAIYLLVTMLIMSSVGYADDTVGDSYTVYWSVNGEIISEQSVEAGGFIDMTPEAPMPMACANYGYTFVGWSDTQISGSQGWEPSPLYTNVTEFPSVSQDMTYYAVFWSDATTGGGTYEMTDVLTREMTGVASGSTTYTEWSGIMASSSAMYAGCSAGGNDAIQMRSSNSNSGIITTASGGTVTMVSVEWSEKTSAGQTLNVYGSNTPFTSVSELYNGGAGTLLGTIVKGSTTELSVSGYEYIGMRSASGALYLSSVFVTWSTPGAGGTNEYVTLCGGHPTSGTLDDGKQWSLENGMLKLIGGGYLTGFADPTDVPWYSFRNEITSIFLGADYLSIGAYLFYDMTNLTSISCPSSYMPTLQENTFSPGLLSQITATVRADLLSQYQADPYWSQMTLETYPDSGGDDTPTVYAEGYTGDGDGLHWVIYNNGQMTFDGVGNIPDFESTSFQPWFEFSEQVTDINFNAQITSVGNYAFSQFSNLNTVLLASSTNQLGDFAFSECSSLTRITAPANEVMSASELVFGNSFDREKLTIEVPKSMVDAYKGAMFWYEFNIVSSTTTTITWDQTDVANVDVSQSSGYLDPQSQTINTISVTAAAPSSGDYSQFQTYSNISYISIQQNGTLTFAPASGKLTRIAINCGGDPTNPENVSAGWTWNSETDKLIWTGEAASSVTLARGSSSGDIYFTIYSIEFTIADDAAPVTPATTTIEWDNAEVSTIALECTNVDEVQTTSAIDGITASLKRTSSGGNCEFKNGDLWISSDCGQITFTSTVGDISGIVLHAGEQVYTIPDNLSTGWTWDDMEKTLTWEGTAAESVTLSGSMDFIVNTIEFTVAIGGDSTSKDDIVGGLVEGDIRWSFNSNTGLLSIYGFGAMPDWVQSMAPWGSYVDSIQEVEVCYGITYVCNGAFANSLNITKVTLAASVDSIGEYIFTGNYSPIQLYVQNMTPPGITTNTFANVNGCVYAYCYESAFPAYDSKPLWNEKVCLGFDTDPEDPNLQSYQLQMIYINNVALADFNPDQYSYNITLPADSETPLITYKPGYTSQSITIEQASSTDGTAYIHVNESATYSLYFGVEGGGEEKLLDSGDCGPSVYWDIYESGLLIIKGSGTMYYWPEYQNIPWDAYRSQITSVQVQEGVESLTVAAFLECVQLSSATLPSSLCCIDDSTFYNCVALRSIACGREYPPSVNGTYPFYNVNLSEITLTIPEVSESLYSSAEYWGQMKIVAQGGSTSQLEPYQLEYIFVNSIGIDGFNPGIYDYDIVLPAGSETPHLSYMAGNINQDVEIEQPTSPNSTGYLHVLIDGVKQATYTINFTCETRQVEIALSSDWRFIMLPSGALAGNWSYNDITTTGDVIWARYDGEKRAAEQSGWTIVDIEQSYYKDWGHIVRAQNGTATLSITMTAEADSSAANIHLRTYEARLPQNASWNLIGNPYNASYDIKGLLAAGITAPIHVWNGTGYTTYNPEYDDYTLQPFEAFFVQTSGTETQSIHLSSEYIVGNGGNGGNTHEQVEGELSGAFSIGESMQVHFSKGNLQYNASSNIWRFAESQYDYIGEENTTNISDPTNGGWIDLFGWGTGDNPTRSTQNGSQYSEFTDWGINPILNGGNIANIWQTLKSDEWTYLLQSRANAQQLQGVATVNGYTGLILLPDNWYDTGHTALVSSYTSGEWETMENAGAVFLPAAGYRWGSTKMFEVGVSGEYWSASFGATDEAYDLDFKSGSVNPMSNYSREYGFSVRLVRQIQ